MWIEIVFLITAFGSFILVHLIMGHPRDYAAQDRDQGLAHLYEARADLMRAESLRLRAVLTDKQRAKLAQKQEATTRHREQVADEVRNENA